MARSRAYQFSEDIGLSLQATSVDTGFIHDMETSMFSRIQSEGRKQMDQVGMSFHSRGMSGTGAETKATGEVISNIAGQAMSAKIQAKAQEEQRRAGFARDYLDVLRHEDNFQIEQERLRMMEPDFFDIAGQIASVGLAFIPG